MHKHYNSHNKGIKYGAFIIKDDIAHWNRDVGIQIPMKRSSSDACQLEGIWDPYHREVADHYQTALTGVCIWGKYDCMFTFKPKSKGNPGAERSLSNPKDKADLLKRVAKGDKIDKIAISAHPFGSYQVKTIAWQADVVARFGIEKLYYVLPLEEYVLTLSALDQFLPHPCFEQINALLNLHHNQLEEKIKAEIHADVEFIYPLRKGLVQTIEESYTWPYQHLDIDLGIEEMEEIYIPYQAMKNGSHIPPILLGMLGTPCPYYERREFENDSEVLTLYPTEY